MSFLSLHGVMVLLSMVASLAGLMLVSRDAGLEDNKYLLLSMTFGCWLVYCLAWTLLRITPPEFEQIISSLRFTVGISYLFTFTCIVSLPLYAVTVPAE
ncbi:hypothetical protein [Candidatus Cyanaurora vandensis]|uniref:hypothetical protein n=1 Tax=Candidatus Cyanaurora vandensis TaxID=2714958 RepID=UPI00257CCC99|nr:hypothetical protein [Candidatus Cyanaurora vandensis]